MTAKFSFLKVFFILFAILFYQQAQAATILVNTNTDTGAVGFCELREAINRMMIGSDGADCVNTSANPYGTADEILFDPGFFNMARIITLNGSQLPPIIKSLIISNTTGNPIGISANFLSRIFSIGGPAPKSVALSELNLTAGRLTSGSQHGGAIFVANAATTLILNRITAFANVTTDGNGGALQNEGATVNIINSTFNGNAAGGTGGAINNESSLGTVNISFSTIMNNISNVDTASAANGGGIYNEGNPGAGSVFIKNTILADNNALVSSGPECAAGTGATITSLGGNLIFNPAGCGALTVPAGAKPDIIYVSPITGALQDNGGTTLTRALLTGSPAIDTADCVVPVGQNPFFACPAIDQIGTMRPQGEGFDRGAYEFRLAGAANQVNLRLNNLVDNPNPGVGDVINYTIPIENNGPNMAANIRLTSIIDPGLDVTAVNTTGIGGTINCSFSDTLVVCEGGTLGVVPPPANPSDPIPLTSYYTITATVLADAPISNHASVIDLTNEDPDPTNNSDTSVIGGGGSGPVGPLADLSVTKTVDLPLATTGDSVVFTMVVRNAGPDTASGVQVRDFISGPFTYSGTTAPNDCITVSSDNGLELLCDVGSIASGAMVSFTVTGTVDDEGQVDNVATVYDQGLPGAAATRDPNGANNVAISSTVVQAEAASLADLSITKTVDLPLSTVDDVVIFTIEVVNDGPEDAANVQVRDFISGPFTYDSTDLPGGCAPTAVANGTELICDVGTVASGGGTVSFQVSGTVDAPGQVDNLVTVYDPPDPTGAYLGTSDPNPFDNAAVASTVVQLPGPAVADLSITKTVDEPLSQAGDTVTFTISVVNAGPSTAFGVEVRELISGPFTFVTDSLGICSPTAVANGIELICQVGEVTTDPAGVTFTVSGTVGPDGGEVHNLATVYDTLVVIDDMDVPPTYDPATGNNVAGSSTVVVAPVCGDGLQEGLEQCDDGNTTPGDGCSEICQLEAICGDGLIEPGEQCDDGNTTPGDGCSATCQYETVCGDGLQEGLEQCDDGNTTPGDGCSDICRLEPLCGDGLIEPGEQCDDGNTTPGDGCSATCQYETVCGDGIQEGLEQCDLGPDNGVPGSGCDSNCHFVPICGDGLQEGLEQCDDGNTTDGDGCSADCRIEGVDLAVTKTASIAQGFFGDIVSYTITVTNNEPALGMSANDAKVTDLLSGPMINISNITPSAGSCSLTNLGTNPNLNRIDCTLGVIAPQETVTITYEGEIEAAGQIDNIASVADTDGEFTTQDPDPTNNSAVASTIGIAPNAPVVDLSVVKSVNVGQAIVDDVDAVTFTLTVTNADPTLAPSVRLTDTFGMAAGAFTMSGTPSFTSGGGTCSDTTLPTLVCDITTFSGNSAVIEITGTLNLPGQVDNLASVADISGQTQDNDLTNNNSVASVIGVEADGPFADLAITKTVDNPQANQGETVIFTVVITNNDTVFTAEGVRITDISTGPLDVTDVTTDSGSCNPTSGSATPFLAVVCDPQDGEIAPEGTVTLTITGTVTGEGQIDNIASVDSSITIDPDSSNNQAVASVNGDLLADLLVTKTVTNGPTFDIGDTVEFEIVIENLGPNDALNVTLSDMQLGGLSFDTLPMGCTAMDNNMNCDVVPTLASGDMVTLNYTSIANVAGLWSNIVTVSSDVEDRQISNNTTSVNVSIGVMASSADLAITKTSNVDQVKSGQTVNYTLTVTNDGPDEAPDVVVTDFVAGSYDAISNIQVSPAVGTCDELDGLITCDIPALPSTPGFDSFTVTYDVLSGDPGEIGNLASVSGAVSDPDETNNSAAKQVKVVEKLADLKITKSAQPNPVAQGDTLTYRLLVKNDGPDTAENVVLVDQISGLFSEVNATTPTGTCTVTSEQEDTATVICELGDMASGTSLEITITVTGEGALSVLSNLASVFSDTPDNRLGNNVTSADAFQTEAPPPEPPQIPGDIQGSGFLGGSSCAFHPTAKPDGRLWYVWVMLIALVGVVRQRRRQG